MTPIRPGANPRTAQNYTEAQAMSSRRLGFTVTRACPLRCAHCSVSAAPDLGATTFDVDFARRVSSQLGELWDADVRFLDFTGGEPTLAPRFVRMVSAEGSAVGMTSGIVTAGHWARTADSARKFIQRFDGIDNWDISTDVYHLPFVPLESVRIAFDELTVAGKNPLIRVARHEVMTTEDARLIERVRSFAGDSIAFQSVGPVGRAAEPFQDIPVGRSKADLAPCPTTGPLVKANGEVSPCCSSLSYADITHPLLVGNAFTDRLVEIIHRWRVHPLLQTIRLWGFEMVLDWLAAAGVDEKYHQALRHRVCEMCVAVLRDVELTELAMIRARALDHRIRVAYALLKQFDEPWMDIELRAEAAGMLQLAGRA